MSLFTLPVQFLVNSSGRPYAAMRVYFYEAGTLDDATVYQDITLQTPHPQPVVADSAGILPPIYLDPTAGNYRVILQTSAGVQIEDIDDYPASSISQSQVAQALYPQTALEQSANITPTNYAYPPGHALRYGTNTTPGTTDMRAALQTTIDLQTAGGPDAYWPAGVYGVGAVAGDSVIETGLLIPFSSANGTTSRVRIRTDGNATVLKALDADMVVLRVSDSHANIDQLTIDGNSQSGVWGIGIVPEDVTQTSEVVHQLYNRITAYVLNCEEGVVLQCGPRVTAVDSGCWYNELDLHVYFCTRGIWLRDPPNQASQVNRNTFRGRVGQNCNTGIQIDSGSTNVVAVNFEGVNTGTSPNATPTAVKIAASDAWSSDNNYNDFLACFLEGNTRDLDNANAQTRIIGGSWLASKFGGGGVKPKVMLVGDPSVSPLVLPGMEYGEGVSGFESGYWAMSKEIADSGHEWQTYALTTSNVTNAASVATGSTSRYTKRGGVVSWHGRLQFDATTDTSEVTITPPVAPNSTVYRGPSSRNSFYSLFVSDGSGAREAVEAGWTDTGAFYVDSPGAWDTGGENNVIWFTVEYHE